LTEPDENARSAYFDCKGHRKDARKQCGPWIVPSGYGSAAARIGYQRHKLPTCPATFIWRSSRDFVSSPVFIASLRYAKARLRPGGVLMQPANVGQLVEIARGELRAFRELKSASKQKT
jgi:hypothetical protein